MKESLLIDRIFLLVSFLGIGNSVFTQTPVLEDYFLFHIPDASVRINGSKSIENPYHDLFFQSYNGSGSTSVSLPWGQVDLISYPDSNSFSWFQLDNDELNYRCGIVDYNNLSNFHYGGIGVSAAYSSGANKFSYSSRYSGYGEVMEINGDTLIYLNDLNFNTGYSFLGILNQNCLLSYSDVFKFYGAGGNLQRPKNVGSHLVNWENFIDSLEIIDSPLAPVYSANETTAIHVTDGMGETLLFESISATNIFRNISGIGYGDGSFFLSGIFSGEANLNLNGNQGTITSIESGHSVYLASYDNNGDLLWNVSACSFDTLEQVSEPGNSGYFIRGNLFYSDPYVFQSFGIRASPGYLMDISEEVSFSAYGNLNPDNTVIGTASSPLLYNQYDMEGALIRSCYFKAYDNNLDDQVKSALSLHPLNDTLSVMFLSYNSCDTISFTNISGHSISEYKIPVEQEGDGCAMVFFNEVGDFKNIFAFPHASFNYAFMQDDLLCVTGIIGEDIHIDPYGEGEIVANPNNSINLSSSFLARYNLTQTSSITEHANNTLKIFPNPAKDQVMIELPDLQTKFSVLLFNSLGQSQAVNFNRGSGILNIGDLAEGIYTLHIQTADKRFTGKFVKE